MQYSIFINQAKALEWGLNPQQAILFSFVYTTPSWANDVKQGGHVFYVLSKQKIVDELPLLTDKPDTAYRLLKQLEEKGLIAVSSTSKVTLIRLLSKARQWNVYPENDLGKISDEPRKNIRATSDKSPTNHITSNQNKDILSDPSFTDQCKEVIDYLNLKAGTSFRLAESHKRGITARLKEGATVDEMKRVIDAKCSEWLNDSRMKKYLRPITLFAASNYDNYVGALPSEYQADSSVDSDDFMMGV